MSQQPEVVTRYHKLIEGPEYRDLGWAKAIEDQMRVRGLVHSGRPVCPVVRPHFLTRRQYTAMSKAADALLSAITRVERLALSTPALLSRIEMLPAEKMLASIEPGYSSLAVTALLDTQVQNGSLRFVDAQADAPFGVAYGEKLADIFTECAPMQELAKKYTFERFGGTEQLLAALLKAWAEWGGKQRPTIGILELKQPFQTMESSEYRLLAEIFRKAGYETEVIHPERLEFRNGVLRHNGFPVNLIYRRMRVQEFLVRFDLDHPLVRAYQQRAVCMVNSFRSDIAQKKALFELLTDDAVVASFPPAERKAIRDFVPWTRLVGNRKTTHGTATVDLAEYIRSHRTELVLKPNEQTEEQRPSFVGAEMDDNQWDRAVRTALRSPYVVQEAVEEAEAMFPLYRFGMLEMKRMRVDVHPHTFYGQVQGASAWISPATGGFSTVEGLAPVFVVDGK